MPKKTPLGIPEEHPVPGKQPEIEKPFEPKQPDIPQEEPDMIPDENPEPQIPDEVPPPSKEL